METAYTGKAFHHVSNWFILFHGQIQEPYSTV